MVKIVNTTINDNNNNPGSINKTFIPRFQDRYFHTKKKLRTHENTSINAAINAAAPYGKKGKIPIWKK